MSATKDTVLVIRKPDATIHVVELANAAALQQYNNKLRPDQKWKFETMDRTKAAALPHIDPDFVTPAQALQKIDKLNADNTAKDEEIEKLRNQLAALTAGNGSGSAASSGNASQAAKVYTLTVPKTVELIKKAKDDAAVDAIVGEDDRAGVLNAAKKQKESFIKK